MADHDDADESSEVEPRFRVKAERIVEEQLAEAAAAAASSRRQRQPAPRAAPYDERPTVQEAKRRRRENDLLAIAVKREKADALAAKVERKADETRALVRQLLDLHRSSAGACPCARCTYRMHLANFSATSEAYLFDQFAFLVQRVGALAEALDEAEECVRNAPL